MFIPKKFRCIINKVFFKINMKDSNQLIFKNSYFLKVIYI